LLSGKEHPRVAESDILSLKVPFFQIETQRRLVDKIDKIESKIDSFRAALRPEYDIINESLCAAFKYPLAEHLSRSRAKYYRKPFSSIAEGFTLRSSARFQHPDFELTEEFFRHGAHTRVKAYLSIPIKLGATAKKTDLLEEGEAYYVHPGATKRQEVIALEDCYQVSTEFYDENKRSALRPGDIIINRSGEALGKVAFFDSDEPAIASDFTMRVRVNEKAHAPFVWYFFRSVMFQAQVQREWRGSSVPNIFPPQVQQMFIVDCHLSRQIELATAISAEVAKLRDARGRVSAMQQEIHALIEAAAFGGRPTMA
jgi:hypothetical protein